MALQVQTEGALIEDLRVGDTQVLTSVDVKDPETGDDFLRPLKRDGTITVLPYGPSPAGPQHGPSRYNQYNIASSAANRLELTARDPQGYGHLKTLVAEADGATITDEVVNLSGNEARMSVGEHFYFPVQEAELAQVKFLNESGEETSFATGVEDKGNAHGKLSDFLDELMDGKTLHIEGFTGSQSISIPGLGVIELGADAQVEGQKQAVSLLIWHRPGTNTICFEPVAGVAMDSEGREQSDGVALGAGETVTLTSRVRLTRSLAGQ